MWSNQGKSARWVMIKDYLFYSSFHERLLEMFQTLWCVLLYSINDYSWDILNLRKVCLTWYMINLEQYYFKDILIIYPFTHSTEYIHNTSNIVQNSDSNLCISRKWILCCTVHFLQMRPVYINLSRLWHIRALVLRISIEPWDLKYLELLTEIKKSAKKYIFTNSC